MKTSRTIRLRILTAGLLCLAATAFAAAAPPPAAPGGFTVSFPGLQTPGGLSAPIQLIIILTILSLGPAIVLCMTCFTRILIVLHFLRQALGTMNMPSNQILVGLTLFLSFFIMGPVLGKVWKEALSPAMDGQISYEEAFNRGSVPMKEFMSRYTRQKDIALFMNIAKLPKPNNIQDIPMQVMVPAYLISELKTAFQIGFVLYLPFVIVDILVSAILLSTGMMMLPPVVISTPFKILLFVMVDGWNLIVGSLVKSFF